MSDTTTPPTTPEVTPPSTNWAKKAFDAVMGKTGEKVDWDATIATKPVVETKPAEAPPNPLTTSPQELIKAAKANINMANIVDKKAVAAVFDSTNPEAQQAALLELLNNTAQMGFLAAHQSSTSAANTALESRLAAQKAELPEQFRQLQTQQAMAAHPMLADPVFKPVVDVETARFRALYPTATPTEIATIVGAYLKDKSGLQTPVAPTSNEPPPTDWDALFASR